MVYSKFLLSNNIQMCSAVEADLKDELRQRRLSEGSGPVPNVLIRTLVCRWNNICSDQASVSIEVHFPLQCLAVNLDIENLMYLSHLVCRLALRPTSLSSKVGSQNKDLIFFINSFSFFPTLYHKSLKQSTPAVNNSITISVKIYF